MTMRNRLYLVRHGENLANLTKEFSYRQVDYSLTPKRVLQAQQTAACFTDKNIHEIYASPLKRAVAQKRCRIRQPSASTECPTTNSSPWAYMKAFKTFLATC